MQIVELPDKLAKNVTFSLTVIKGANPEGEKLAQCILLPEGQQVLLKYGFPILQKSTSLPEPQGVALMVVQQSKLDIVGRHWPFYSYLSANRVLDDVFNYLVPKQ